MNQGTISTEIRQSLHGMWVHRWWGLAAAWVVLLLGALAIGLSSDRFEASARVYVDTQTVLKPLMQGLAYSPDADQEVRMLARTLVTRPNVEFLMKQPGIRLEPEDPKDHERTVMRLMNTIKFSSSGVGNLYSLSYRDSDAERARHLVDALLVLFVDANGMLKRKDSDQAREFIDSQIKSYEQKLGEAEGRLKDFKVRNFGLSGVSNQDFFSRMAELNEEVTRLKVELAASERARDVLRRELSGEDPQLPADLTGGPAAPPSELDLRLQAQQRQLDELLRRYTEAHPDVQALRRSLAQGEAEKRRADELRAAGRAGHAATSPVFQRIRIALAEAEAGAGALRSRLAAQQARLDEARALATRIPQVEEEYAQLNRDYDVLRKNYEQLIARREAASMGSKLDETSKMADFRIVEPVRVGASPVFPSRRLMSAALVLAALAVGAVVAYGISRAFPTIVDENALRQLCRRPVLGTISLVMSATVQARQRRMNRQFVMAIALLVAADVLWVGWLSWQRLHGA